jgi:hypothetical protein
MSGVLESSASTDLGAFAVFARDTCPKTVRLYFSIDLIASGKGPDGNAKAEVWWYGGHKAAARISPTKGIKSATDQRSFGVTIYVRLTDTRATMIYYHPVISFNTTLSTPLKESEGEATGSVQYLGFDEL